MECPKCGGPMWDNRADKRNPKSPDFKCKNKECAHAIWEKKSQAKPNVTRGGGAYSSWAELALTYRQAHTVAMKVLGDSSPEAIQSATATVFIAATNSGLAIRPQPEPEPEPEPEPPSPTGSDLPF